MKHIPSYIEVLKNQILTGFEQESEDRLIIKTRDPAGVKHVYKFYHEQDCCESVGITSIEGPDADAVVGKTLEDVAEDITNADSRCDSSTTTTHTFAFSNGLTITVTWLGESNGYYSESVSFAEVVG